MVPLETLYTAFLALLNGNDEWDTWETWQIEEDIYHLYLAAKVWFKFPRCSIDATEDKQFFVDENITNDEIQVLAAFMKSCWLERVIQSWDNLKPMYSERDFSPSKLLAEFEKLESNQVQKARRLESVYYRSPNKKPYNYSNLAGG